MENKYRIIELVNNQVVGEYMLESISSKVLTKIAYNIGMNIAFDVYMLESNGKWKFERHVTREESNGFFLGSWISERKYGDIKKGLEIKPN